MILQRRQLPSLNWDLPSLCKVQKSSIESVQKAYYGWTSFQKLMPLWQNLNHKDKTQLKSLGDDNVLCVADNNKQTVNL